MKTINFKIRTNRIISINYSIVIIFSLVFFSFASADFTSTSYELENPSTAVIGGGQSSSASFQYLSNTGQLNGGQSTSTSFTQNAGFLYFPSATSPIVSATAGSTQVSLTWTASTGIFASVTSYEVGVSTASSGTYTYTNVGNVLSSIKTGLTNNTPYFFKIRTYAAGILLTESAVVSATPVASSSSSSSSSGSGGSSAGSSGSVGSFSIPSSVDATVNFTGRAYPNSSVTLLKDAQIIATTVAGSDASFSMQLNNLSVGTYVFSVYSTDKDDVRSPLQSFPITVTAGVTVNVGGIFIAPTISGDKSQVKQGDNITFFGQAVPQSEVTIAIHSNQEIFKKIQTDKNGVYLQTVDTSPLEIGGHSAKSKVAFDGQISAYSAGYNFIVGNDNIETDKNTKKINKGDLNGDNKVNLIDFSIAAFWYKKTNLSDQMKNYEKTRLNGDGKIDIIDFSIMAYYWTG
ncbi:MAG: dockerin type I domain-containing protein [bacterium]